MGRGDSIEPMQTIGVAVAIPEPWASRLQDFRAGLGDLTARKIPTHITILPPVEVGEPGLEVLASHLARAAAAVQAFEVHLRGTGSFRPVSPVVFVSLVEGISQCEQLFDAVRRGPLARETEFPYHPHVTVAHHLDDALLDQAFEDLADFECRFTVECFSLYVHEEGAGWQSTRDFPLVGGEC